MRNILLIVFILTSTVTFAQDGLFMTEKPPARSGVVFCFNGGYDFTGGDMADRFGPSARAGVGLLYKTKSNWMIGPKFDYIFGNKMREDSLLINVKDKYGSFINQDGQRVGVNIYERGYMVGIQAGKIFAIGKKSSDNGILAMTTVGFMEHKIFIRDRDKKVTALLDDYGKGYDRLTNGLFIEQYVGYNYFANNALANFHIGLDIAAGFTKCRRDFIYDIMRTDNEPRIDLLFGIRAGWYIPIFKRKSEEFYFE